MTSTLKKKGVLDKPLRLITEHWSEIVGAPFALRATPQKLKNGVLTIHAPAGAALELQHQGDKIVTAVNDLLTYEEVKRIKFTQ